MYSRPHQQVAALDQFRPDLAGEEHVLVEGSVPDPRREQGDARLRPPGRRQLPQRRPQQVPVVLRLPDPATPVQPAQARLHRPAVGDHVGNAGRNAEIVLQHREPVGRAHHVGPADGDPRARRRPDTPHLRAVLRTAVHHVGRDDAVRDDAAVAVHVVQETVQGEYALPEARLQQAPLRRRQDAGHAVDRDDALVGLAVAVHREGDALGQERARHLRLDLLQLRGRYLPQDVVQEPAVRPWRRVRLEELVVDGGVELVRAEIHAGDVDRSKRIVIVK